MQYERLTWVEISQDAFEDNVESLAKVLGPRIKISLVVKANAYGHGIVEIARLAEHNDHIHMLCTATLSEALFLRRRGIIKPLLVLGIIDEELAHAIDNDIDLLVGDHPALNDIGACAKSMRKVCKIHLKVDTGLTRLGVSVHEAVSFVKYAQSLPFIAVKGICSHFAESAGQDQTFTRRQYDAFVSVLKNLERERIHVDCRHITNSAASPVYDLDMFSMVRVGACVYGLLPSHAHYERVHARHPTYNPRSVLSWHARIIALRTIPTGTTVGYDRTYTTQRETVLGLLPIGYSDGYDKRLSNKGLVYVPDAHTFAPVIGRVAMNMTALDVTDVAGVARGHEVIVLGARPEIDAFVLAELTGCHNAREITLNIRPTIERIVCSQHAQVAQECGALKVSTVDRAQSASSHP